MLTIVLKRGTVVTYKGDAFTDYDLRGDAFVVMRGDRWVAVINWSEVEAVYYTEADKCD